MNIKHLILLSLISLPAHGEIADAYLSEECGTVETRLDPNGEYGELGESLRVFFQDFNLLLEKPGNTSRDCLAKVKLRIPAGQKFRFHSATAEGSHSISPESRGDVNVGFKILESGDEAFSEEPIQGEGDFFAEAKNAYAHYTNCSDRDQFITIEASIGASLAHRGYSQSLVEMDEATPGGAFVCNWEYAPCEPLYFEKPLVGYYKSYNGRNYRASISINGQRGSFKSDEGFTAELSQLNYSNNGRTLTGKWKMSRGQGWFEWHMEDIETGDFKGSWGDYARGKVKRGSWFGSYKQSSSQGSRQPALLACLKSAVQFGQAAFFMIFLEKGVSDDTFFVCDTFIYSYNLQWFILRSNMDVTCSINYQMNVLQWKMFYCIAMAATTVHKGENNMRTFIGMALCSFLMSQTLLAGFGDRGSSKQQYRCVYYNDIEYIQEGNKTYYYGESRSESKAKREAQRKCKFGAFKLQKKYRNKMITPKGCELYTPCEKKQLRPRRIV